MDEAALPDAPEPAGNVSAQDNSRQDGGARDAMRETAPAVPGDAIEVATPPGRPPFSAYRIFIGREGLRAGWSLLIYVVLFVLLTAISGFLIQKVHDYRIAHRLPGAVAQSGSKVEGQASASAAEPATLMPAKAVMVGEGMPFLCVVVATWVMGKIERRPNAVFGLGGREWLHNFLGGLGWGVGLLSLLIFSLRAMGLLVFDARLLFGREVLRYGAAWFLAFLFVGLFEEYFFRGYLQFTLARGLSGIYGWLHAPASDALGFWTSAVLLSFGFGFTHRANAGESPIGLLSAGVMGVVFCLSLWRTGSLWWAVGFHAAWDWAQSFLYGVADSGMMVEDHLFATHPLGRPILSGGLTGPEGSIFILPTVVLTAAAIVLTLRNRRADDLMGDGYGNVRPGMPVSTADEARQTRLHLDLP